MPESAPVHGCMILAAGASRRLGRSKQLLRHEGQPLVRRAAQLALGTEPACTLVVVGCEADAVHAALGDLPVQRVDCADWQRGMGASLRAGLSMLPEAICGALIVVCDQPLLDAAHLAALLGAWRRQPARAAASYYAGRLGVPALLPRAWFAALGAPGDHGARELLAQRAAEVTAVVNERLAVDIDRPADLDTLRPSR